MYLVISRHGKNILKKSPHTLGFTLVELMVVIGLIGLLTMLAVPAFQSSNRGARLRTAVFQFNTTVSLARQTAITTRQRVLVVVPDDDPVLFGGNYNEYVRKAFRAYAIYGREDGYLSEWRELPQGVVFDPDENPQGRRNFFLSGGATPIFLEDEIPFPNEDAPMREIFALGFWPDGTMGGSSPAMFYFAEGWTEYNPDTGSFDDIFLVEDLPIKGLSVNALTGQTNIREFERSN